jgi:hypothetical protein
MLKRQTEMRVEQISEEVQPTQYQQGGTADDVAALSK